MVTLVGYDFRIEFEDMLGAYGRAQTTPLAEELVNFDSCHILPLVLSRENDLETG